MNHNETIRCGIRQLNNKRWLHDQTAFISKCIFINRSNVVIMIVSDANQDMKGIGIYHCK